MESLINSMAFPGVQCSYTESLPGLSFIERDEPATSILREPIIHRIPIRQHKRRDSRDSKHMTILYCHGNGHDIGQMDIAAMSDIFKANVTVLDYSGFGAHSCRSSSEYQCQQDVKSVYNHLIYTENVSSDMIIIWGRSLGSAPACWLSHYLVKIQRPPAALILQSPLYSAMAIYLGFSMSVLDSFNNASLATEITCPTLVVHGAKDKVIPVDCGKNLSVLFPKLFGYIQLDDKGHNDISDVEMEPFITDMLKNINR